MQTALADERWLFVGQGGFSILFVCIEPYLIHSFGLIWIDIELRINQESKLSSWLLCQSGRFYGLSHLVFGFSHLVYGLSQFQRRQTASADERWSIRELGSKWGDSYRYFISAPKRLSFIARHLGSGKSNICCIIDWRGKFTGGKFTGKFTASLPVFACYGFLHLVLIFWNWRAKAISAILWRVSTKSGDFSLFHWSEGKSLVSIFIFTVNVFKGGLVTSFHHQWGVEQSVFLLDQ
jgi:hypothetical protein